jgi:DNA-binding NarL/FixJ family response regulator
VSHKLKTEQARRRRRILLVDRHPLMRGAAAGWINRCPGLEVCGMVSGTAQGFRAVSRLRPDVVVSEILRPRDLGFIRELHRRHPRLPILVFSIQDEALYGAQAREAGACRYLMKDAGGDELVRSIRAMVRGRRNHPPGTSKRVA